MGVTAPLDICASHETNTKLQTLCMNMKLGMSGRRFVDGFNSHLSMDYSLVPSKAGFKPSIVEAATRSYGHALSRGREAMH